MDEKKLELLRDFSSYFESAYNFPPLTSKIYTYLLIEIEREGVNFDELVEVFNASKSSVSNSLNFLTQINYIEYFSKIDCRKRLYRVAPENMLIRLQKISMILEQEKQLTEKFKSYALDLKTNPTDLSIQKCDIYTDHLESAVKQLNKTIKKLENLTENT